MGNKKAVDRAYTKRGRERLALQQVVNDSGRDATDLEYVEDKRSGTSKVVDKDGEVQARFAW